MNFLVIEEQDVVGLKIPPADCVAWAREAFLQKDNCILTSKACHRLKHDSFFTTMPCTIPKLNCMGVKVVSRLPGNIPPLKSDISLFDTRTGERIALMGANWITAMRTGAVATLSAQVASVNFYSASFGFVGLGNVARAVLRCLVSQFPLDKLVDVWLLEYADQAERMIQDFKDETRVRFHVAKSRRELVENTSVLFSCVTVMHEQFLSSDSYPEGYTLIPVHTRGFEDCDLVFDRIIGDDLGHEREFKNFNRFKSFLEMKDVLSGNISGRTDSRERIICYNVGIALQDIWFASKILQNIAR